MSRRRTSELTPTPRGFMEYVEFHERNWGEENYRGRPKLSQIITSPVVCFWNTEDADHPFKITLHEDTQAVEKHLLRMIFGANFTPPNEKLIAIFQNQEKLAISRINIEFRVTDA